MPFQHKQGKRRVSELIDLKQDLTSVSERGGMPKPARSIQMHISCTSPPILARRFASRARRFLSWLVVSAPLLRSMREMRSSWMFSSRAPWYLEGKYTMQEITITEEHIWTHHWEHASSQKTDLDIINLSKSGVLNHKSRSRFLDTNGSISARAEQLFSMQKICPEQKWPSLLLFDISPVYFLLRQALQSIFVSLCCRRPRRGGRNAQVNLSC